MQNKAMIVDNQATILGGRNVGDEYMGLHPHFNSHDLDVVGIGPVARQASAVFDLYWNSEGVMPVSALRLAIPKADQAVIRAQLVKELSANPKLATIPVAPQTWTAELAVLPSQLHIGKSRVYSDVPEDGRIRHEMAEIIFTFFGHGQARGADR